MNGAMMEFHPAANEFPMMDEKRFSELKADIETHGLREPVTLCGGKILDGRNRFRACTELGIDPPTKQFTGDPWAYVWSLNGERRDLNADQRYLIWKRCGEQSEAWAAEQDGIKAEANRKRSEAAKRRERKSDGTLASGSTDCRTTGRRDKTNQAKAAASKTNAGAVARGDKLEKEAPDLAEKVRKGELKPAAARRLAKQRSVSGKAKSLPKGKYGVIYCDPPWSYNDKLGGELDQSYGGAEKHYPAMSLSELKALPVPDMAGENCVLFLWATSPLLPDALELAKAWSFKYKSAFIWDKVKHNMGHYCSVRHELLLICTKGSATPEVAKLFDSVQTIERTDKHSEKPEEFRTIIETLYPSWKKVELFARGIDRKGWKTWGNEAE